MYGPGPPAPNPSAGSNVKGQVVPLRLMSVEDPLDLAVVCIGRLERDKARLERDKAELTEERDRSKRRKEHLEKELEAAQRAGRRQAAPFAKDRPQGSGKRARTARRGGLQEAGVPPEASAG